MSENPSAFPPPPSPSPQAPPPPPVYQGPPAPDYVQPYMQQQPPYVPQPYAPTAGVVGGAMAGGLMYQLGGPAAWSIAFGLISIVVPFATNYYFPILPIAGAISAIRAIQRGRVVGGIVGIAVNVVGGLVSLLASGLIGR